MAANIKERTGKRFLLDSNIIIYLSKNEITDKSILSQGNEYAISIITYMEVKGFRFSSDVEKEFISGLLDSFKILNVDTLVAEKVIEIRSQIKIDLPDAIIGATALVNDYVLLTRDVKDFTRIDGLQIRNPFDTI